MEAIGITLVCVAVLVVPALLLSRRQRHGLRRHRREAHAKYPYSFRIDFKDFFPSINPDDLYCAIEHPDNQKRLELTVDDKEFLLNVFFIRNADGRLGLPIGAPSSPILSNGVMRSLDVAIDTFSKQHEFVYTRYADDLVFSTNRKDESKPFLEGLRTVIANSQHPKPIINEQKTMFMSRNARRVVTGLIINPDSSLSIGRGKKRHLRKYLNDFKYGKLDKPKTHYLQGYLAFILDVEPSLFDRLCLKYGAELLLLALKQRGDRAI
jgi:RNA-directed DNA polymerase